MTLRAQPRRPYARNGRRAVRPACSAVQFLALLTIHGSIGEQVWG